MLPWMNDRTRPWQGAFMNIWGKLWILILQSAPWQLSCTKLVFDDLWGDKPLNSQHGPISIPLQWCLEGCVCQVLQKRNETSYLPLQPKALGRKLARFVQPFNTKVCAALKPAVSLHTSINIIKTILSFSTRWQEEKYDETPGWFFFKTPKKLAQEIPSKFVHTIQNNIKITQMDTRGAKKQRIAHLETIWTFAFI